MEGKLVMVPAVCPRCKFNWIPCNERPGEYPGALSRVDNKTEICSACGEDEALMQHYEGKLIPKEEWGVTPKYSLQNIDGGGKPSVDFVEEDDDVLCRFIDKENNRRITVITAPRESLKEDGPVVTQFSNEDVIVMFSDEFITSKVESAIEKNSEEFGEMAVGIGLAFVMRSALEAAMRKFDESF